MKMILLTGFHENTDRRRQGEFLQCILHNIRNNLLDEIHLFIEEPIGFDKALTAYPMLADPKIHLVAQGRRVTYQDLFGYANRYLMGRCVIIANADIYFDSTLRRLDGYDISGKLLCLSRWDVQADGSACFFDHPSSQDAWIFQPPIPTLPCDFHFGLLGCDNRLAYEAEHAGLMLSNPSRSLRAYHLHVGQVRRWGVRKRLEGPAKPVPAGFLGTPWIWFIVPCMGRLNDLRQTAGSLLEQPKSSYVLVDYSCPEEAGSWARECHPDIKVVEVGGRSRFQGAEARNRGAAVVDDDGILCFFDANMRALPGFSEYVLTHLEEGTFMIPDRQGDGFDSTLICPKTAFDRVGGFDEAFVDWGEECGDLKDSLRRFGLAERSFPATLLSSLGNHAEPRRGFRVIHDQEINRAIHAAYRRAKSVILEETGQGGVMTKLLRKIFSAIMYRHLSARGITPDVDCGVVAFHETMGYSIARMEVGISSHNNDPRPFIAIPEALNGLQFTQVVASVVSPVEVQFLTPGKLYVLAGTDWEGYYSATAWLCQRAYREALPLVETERGTAFEVWSLTGEVGERFILPTQVMLAAERLVRKGSLDSPP